MFFIPEIKGRKSPQKPLRIGLSIGKYLYLNLLFLAVNIVVLVIAVCRAPTSNISQYYFHLLKPVLQTTMCAEIKEDPFNSGHDTALSARFFVIMRTQGIMILPYLRFQQEPWSAHHSLC